jgi:hypothetical protein
MDDWVRFALVSAFVLPMALVACGRRQSRSDAVAHGTGCADGANEACVQASGQDVRRHEPTEASTMS